MDDGRGRELRALRERAYGPAGVRLSEAEVRRLQELEHRGSAERAPLAVRAEPESAPAPPAEPQPEYAPSPPTEPEPEHGEPAAETARPSPTRGARPSASPPSRRVARRRLIGVWVASVVVALVVGASLVTWLSRPGATVDGARHVATLTIDPDFEWPDVFDGAGHGFEEWNGLAVMSGIRGWSEGDGTCLAVVDAESLEAYREDPGDGFRGPSMVGCGAGAFPAIVTMDLAALSSDALQGAFPDGTALQFVDRGDTVDVYSDSR